ncbi:gephyrin-like molybdotransferase Glp [Bacillus salitolerans]|uniref:Molybdopterin molybdenumtransferase n=1 Tax=Bacillus salitolerans TaxID=1437434 RepID=A0ABW4LQL7_9BACI
MVEIRKPISISDAVRRVMNFTRQGEVVVIPISKAYGHFLAEDVVATHNVPPFDRSPYDGYAIRAEDSREANINNPIVFEVIDVIGAGYVSNKEVGSNQAVRIMTGAQLPKGCNAVVMLELTKEFEQEQKKYFSINRSFLPGDNISLEGEDTKVGTVLVKKGTKINPGVQALLATFGYSEVKVAKKPMIGVFATGTELLNVNEPLQPGKIRNSNSYMVCAQIERSGAEAAYYGILPDNFEVSYNSLLDALDRVDILITTGGVSVGDYDYLPDIYKKLGANVLFNKVAMRPGSVTTVAEWNGKLLFGLSGNPSACYVGFELFARPAVRTLLFSQEPHLNKAQAILQADYPKPNPFTRLVRSTVTIQDGHLVVKPSGFDKSNAVSSLANANALMVLPGGTRGYEKGMKVNVLLLEDDVGCEWPWS